MKKPIELFLASLEEGRRPDLHTVSRWLANQQVNLEEWEIISAKLCECYEFKDEDELTAHLAKPVFTGVSDYVDDFSDMMDEVELSGVIRDYVEYTRGMEAPTPYHFGTILAVLAATLRRQVYIDQGYYEIWPATQVMLIGPSGKVKKSTAASYGVNLAMEVAAESGVINLLPDEGSGEALKTELAHLTKKKGEATGLLYVSELGTFLGKQDYNVNLVQTLTDLFDSRNRKRRRTHAQGNQKLDNIAVSFLGCSNEDWLADAIPPSAFGGGFFGRMLVFYQHDTDRCFARPRRPADPSARERIKDFLAAAQFVKGMAVLTPAADRWFDERYRQVKKEWPEDERLVPFWERIPDHILRLGMLLSISDDPQQRDEISVSDRHLLQADGVIRWILRYLPKVYSYLGGTAFGEDQRRIYNAIKRKGGMIEEAELARKMSRRMSRRRLEDHLDTMKKNKVARRKKLNPWEGRYGWEIIPGKEI
jgi:hypothetical protein